MLLLFYFKCAFRLFQTHYNGKKIRKNLYRRWQWHDNQQWSDKGRLWIGWDPAQVVVEVLSTSIQVIDCRVKDVRGDTSLRISFVYGPHHVGDRRQLCANLEGICGSLTKP